MHDLRVNRKTDAVRRFETWLKIQRPEVARRKPGFNLETDLVDDEGDGAEFS